MSKRYVFSTADTVRYRFPTHTNDLVLDRADAATSEVFIVVLEPGEAPPLHVHNDTEQIFYLLTGHGTLEIAGDEGGKFPVKPGDVVRVPPGSYHRIHCESAEPLTYLSVDCFLNGRPEAEPTWDSHVINNCKMNGWNFDEVKRTKKD